MRGDRSCPAGLVLIAASLLASCGGAETSPKMAIEFERKELLADSTQIAIYFYTGEMSCEAIRASVPHPPSVLGPFVAPIDETGRTQGISFPLDAVPANTYVVFVDAINASGTIVGSGCAPAQQVFEGEVSRIRIKIS